jgi:hypothetical protein
MKTSILISLGSLFPAVAAVLLNSHACTVDFCRVSFNVEAEKCLWINFSRVEWKTWKWIAL